MKADKPKFKCGEIVYHLADGSRGVITGVVYEDDGMAYRVAFSPSTDSRCQGSEITNEYGDVKALIED